MDVVYDGRRRQLAIDCLDDSPSLNPLLVDRWPWRGWRPGAASKLVLTWAWFPNGLFPLGTVLVGGFTASKADQSSLPPARASGRDWKTGRGGPSSNRSLERPGANRCLMLKWPIAVNWYGRLTGDVGQIIEITRTCRWPVVGDNNTGVGPRYLIARVVWRKYREVIERNSNTPFSRRTVSMTLGVTVEPLALGPESGLAPAAVDNLRKRLSLIKRIDPPINCTVHKDFSKPLIVDRQ